MQHVEITCVDRGYHSPGQDPHEAIQAVGGAGWGPLPVDNAIKFIDDGQYSFYTRDAAGDPVPVAVVRGKNRRYLRTIANGRHTDNLLSKNACAIR